MKIKICIFVLLLALVLLVTGMALATSDIELPRWLLGSAASDSAGANITLRATLGQPLVGVVSGNGIILGQGFWHGGQLSGRANQIYLPLVAGQ